MGKRKLASIQYVHNITPIEGAEKIECVHVLGWQCVDRILPEPIVDRAMDIRYFELTPSKIYDYMISTDDSDVNENDNVDVNSNQ